MHQVGRFMIYRYVKNYTAVVIMDGHSVRWIGIDAVLIPHQRDRAMRPNLNTRIYPYTAWVLTRSFVVVEVEVVGPTADGQNERSIKGKWYAADTLFSSHDAAVEAGRARIETARAEIARRAAVLEEKSALLDRLSGR